MASVEELEDEEEEEEVEDVEPLLYDRAKWVAWAVEEKERSRREEEEKARKREENRRRSEAHDAVMDSIIEHDPKVGRDVYTRFFLRDFSVFNIDEESSVPPMRYTDSIYQDEFGLEDSANILSVSIVSSDVGFPVDVYGRVIARDSIDYKCIYLFHRNRDDCQRVNEDGMLILTGPYRGLVLVDFIYLEIDLKIREEGVPERPFSKGLISIDGRVLSREKDVMVRSETLESWLSTTEVRFTTVLNAVECTFEIKLTEGLFKGNITVGIADKARKLDNEHTIVIHDSTADGVVTSDESGVIKLRRSVITICLERNVMFRINNEAAGVCVERTFGFTPRRTGVDEEKITCGAGKFGFRIVWSLMDFRL
ncbi:hypothetical protein CFC21_004954 [Triticum aestivum]|uniref:DUF6598 domain-containing protein n=3 Tax=Triticum TaxID=4564 RepID=A0A9R0QJ98_TRITD|nr:uncharacterized protein LOC123103949 [Triticum aestivum]KAF6987298.1 hypothetical protein CFC21_004954 [Triticum aestivum]VAH12480.1 unnamed protein product [Triticum turgidum subsp. durum]